jgi:hypothetical protein
MKSTDIQYRIHEHCRRIIDSCLHFGWNIGFTGHLRWTGWMIEVQTWKLFSKSHSPKIETDKISEKLRRRFVPSQKLWLLKSHLQIQTLYSISTWIVPSQWNFTQAVRAIWRPDGEGTMIVNSIMMAVGDFFCHLSSEKPPERLHGPNKLRRWCIFPNTWEDGNRIPAVLLSVHAVVLGLSTEVYPHSRIPIWTQTNGLNNTKCNRRYFSEMCNDERSYPFLMFRWRPRLLVKSQIVFTKLVHNPAWSRLWWRFGIYPCSAKCTCSRFPAFG